MVRMELPGGIRVLTAAVQPGGMRARRLGPSTLQGPGDHAPGCRPPHSSISSPSTKQPHHLVNVTYTKPQFYPFRNKSSNQYLSHGVVLRIKLNITF